MGYIDIGQNEDGATLACGGKRLTRGDYAHGYFIEPTVFTDVAPDMRIAQEEIFGPVTTVIPTNSLDEAVEIAQWRSIRTVRCDLHAAMSIARFAP